MESNLIKVSRLLYFCSKDTESAFAEPTCTDKGFSLFAFTNCRAREVNFNPLACRTFRFYLTFPILYCTGWNFVTMLLRLSHETHCRWEALFESSRRNKRYTTSPLTCVQNFREKESSLKLNSTRVRDWVMRERRRASSITLTRNDMVSLHTVVIVPLF